MMFWKAAILAFTLAVPACDAPQTAPQTAAPPDPNARPALWKLSDADTTLYFFGTVHILPPTLSWRSEAVDRAYAASQAIYFETDLEPDRLEAQAIVDRLAIYPPSERLTDRLTPDQQRRLETTAGELEVPMPVLNTYRPWYAALYLSDAAIRRAGYDTSSGVERVFGALARREGKDIRMLETYEQQMLSFALLPEADQLNFLVGGLGEVDNIGPTLSNMVNTWKAGDMENLHRILIDEDLGRQPAVYDALLAKRNANWTPAIDTLMKSEVGTFFIAVGTAHLIGKDSVFEKLKPMGYAVERLQ